MISVTPPRNWGSPSSSSSPRSSLSFLAKARRFSSAFFSFGSMGKAFWF